MVDLFAGSGALGIEALSRGAAHATFVDHDRRAVRGDRGQPGRHRAGRRGPPCVRARPSAVLADAARRRRRRWSLALLDPPYAFDEWDRLLAAVPADLVVVESGRPVAVPAGWRAIRERRYGGTLVAILRPPPPAARAGPTPGVTVALVLYPGSFDPIHNGHLEIIETASRLFDGVVVAAMRNPQKGEPLFSYAEREEMLRESVAHLDNVKVTMFSSLVVDLARTSAPTSSSRACGRCPTSSPSCRWPR